MKLIWRKIDESYTLVEMFDVKMKADLPYEYVNGKGPKFWLVPADTLDDVRHNAYIWLAGRAGKYPAYHTSPQKLYIGTVLTHKENELVNAHLLEASRRLHDLNIEIIDAEMVTTIL